ncbi:hypothetical protein SAY86_010250 [Trapa natans]|uniref:WRKY domain-containing protein n=1 Tax=Trapa natans TaxID=22666 RepID=A0AAN7L5C3_TRANT|nr:hypothetical protein SAY86_010250 [Trapa natans]
MDNHTVSLLLYGCKLARELESNLPNSANQPHSIADSCDQILRVFGAVQERIADGSVHHQHGVQVASFMHLPAAVLPLQQHHAQQLPLQSYSPLPAAPRKTPFSGIEATGASARRVAGDGQLAAASEGSDPAGGMASSSSSQFRQKPRRSDVDPGRRTVNMEAPLYGNPEIPPEDGFIWKKYGQKEILGSLFPRSYYRCTHQKLYQCPAKKQVQRLDSNPRIFQVIYRGEHICHMFSTAPSVASQSPPRTLGMPIVSMDMTHVHPTLPQLPAVGMAPSMAGMRDDTYTLLADAMFNSFHSGSNSTTNSMDVIFTSVDRDHQHKPTWLV